MEREKIIPTRRKTKIPHLLSYPVGAKAISGALTGVPQFDQLFIEFWFWNQLARLHGTAAPYSIIDAEYSGPRRHLSKSNHPFSQDARRWAIIVHAVPRTLRHQIQTRIVNEALPVVRAWLLANPHSAEREGSHRLSFSFDELNDELKCEEHASIEWQTRNQNAEAAEPRP